MRPPLMPAAPNGDPSAGMEDADCDVTIRDARLRMTQNYAPDGDSRRRKNWEDVRFSRFKINPKIDPKIFESERKAGAGPFFFL